MVEKLNKKNYWLSVIKNTLAEHESSLNGLKDDEYLKKALSILTSENEIFSSTQLPFALYSSLHKLKQALEKDKLIEAYLYFKDCSEGLLRFCYCILFYEVLNSLKQIESFNQISAEGKQAIQSVLNSGTRGFTFGTAVFHLVGYGKKTALEVICKETITVFHSEELFRILGAQEKEAIKKLALWRNKVYAHGLTGNEDSIRDLLFGKFEGESVYVRYIGVLCTLSEWLKQLKGWLDELGEPSELLQIKTLLIDKPTPVPAPILWIAEDSYWVFDQVHLLGTKNLSLIDALNGGRVIKHSWNFSEEYISMFTLDTSNMFKQLSNKTYDNRARLNDRIFQSRSFSKLPLIDLLLDKLSMHPRLLLQGSSGLGKSYAMRILGAKLRDQGLSETDCIVLQFSNLNQYSLSSILHEVYGQIKYKFLNLEIVLPKEQHSFELDLALTEKTVREWWQQLSLKNPDIIFVLLFDGLEDLRLREQSLKNILPFNQNLENIKIVFSFRSKAHLSKRLQADLKAILPLMNSLNLDEYYSSEAGAKGVREYLKNGCSLKDIRIQNKIISLSRLHANGPISLLKVHYLYQLNKVQLLPQNLDSFDYEIFLTSLEDRFKHQGYLRCLYWVLFLLSEVTIPPSIAVISWLLGGRERGTVGDTPELNNFAYWLHIILTDHNYLFEKRYYKDLLVGEANILQHDIQNNPLQAYVFDIHDTLKEHMRQPKIARKWQISQEVQSQFCDKIISIVHQKEVTTEQIKTAEFRYAIVNYFRCCSLNKTTSDFNKWSRFIPDNFLNIDEDYREFWLFSLEQSLLFTEICRNEILFHLGCGYLANYQLSLGVAKLDEANTNIRNQLQLPPLHNKAKYIQTIKENEYLALLLTKTITELATFWVSRNIPKTELLAEAARLADVLYFETECSVEMLLSEVNSLLGLSTTRTTGIAKMHLYGEDQPKFEKSAITAVMMCLEVLELQPEEIGKRSKELVQENSLWLEQLGLSLARLLDSHLNIEILEAPPQINPIEVMDDLFKITDSFLTSAELIQASTLKNLLYFLTILSDYCAFKEDWKYLSLLETFLEQWRTLFQTTPFSKESILSEYFDLLTGFNTNRLGLIRVFKIAKQNNKSVQIAYQTYSSLNMFVKIRDFSPEDISSIFKQKKELFKTYILSSIEITVALRSLKEKELVPQILEDIELILRSYLNIQATTSLEERRNIAIKKAWETRALSLFLEMKARYLYEIGKENSAMTILDECHLQLRAMKISTFPLLPNLIRPPSFYLQN